MNKPFPEHGFFWILLALLSVFYFSTLGEIPLHPDESTQIFMSEDFSRLVQDPLSMTWSPGDALGAKSRLRLLDAPLTRYLIGLAREITGTEDLTGEWDWGQTWSENRQNDALPTPRQLMISRGALTLLLPASLTLLYFTITRYLGKTLGIMGTLFLGLHPLTLLHARRAMAEGAILFGVSFFLWSIRFRLHKPWVVGLAAAAAYNAKQSTAALIPLGLLAVCWGSQNGMNLKERLKNALLFLAPVLILTLALNPVMWTSPLETFPASWRMRLIFTEKQIQTVSNDVPAHVLDTLPKKVLSLVNNLYLSPPAVADVGNYAAQLEEPTRDYLSKTYTTWGRALVPGGLLLTLTLLGGYVVLRHFSSTNPRSARELALITLSTLAQGAAVLIFVPLPWQRYVMPLLPMVAFWATASLQPLFESLGLISVPYQNSPS